MMGFISKITKSNNVPVEKIKLSFRQISFEQNRIISNRWKPSPGTGQPEALQSLENGFGEHPKIAQQIAPAWVAEIAVQGACPNRL